MTNQNHSDALSLPIKGDVAPCELLPCPFCASEGEELGLLYSQDGQGWNIRCYGCNVETAYQVTEVGAVNAWNRRAAMTAANGQAAERIAELEAARWAYASEFPPDLNGDPDTGSIHQNIRALKAERDAWHKDALYRESLLEKADQAIQEFLRKSLPYSHGTTDQDAPTVPGVQKGSL